MRDLPARIQTDKTDAAAFWSSLDGYLKMLQGNSGFKDATLEIRKARGYTDLNGYLEVVSDYIAGYICKDAVSVDDAGDIFEDLVRNAEDGTSFQSLAMQMQMRVLKSSSLKSTEAHWLGQGMPLVASSFSFYPVSRPGSRVVQGAAPAGGDDDEAQPTRVGNNQWDQYMKFANTKRPNGSFLYEDEAHVCFDRFCTDGGRKVPTWNFWSTDVVWPLDSEHGLKWCEDSLTRYKPVRSLDEVLGSHRTHAVAMHAFLATPVCPEGLRKQVARAALAVEYGQIGEGVRCRGQPKRRPKRRTGGDADAAGGGRSDDESDGEEDDSDGASALFGWGASGGDDMVLSDLDQRQRGDDVRASWRVHLPSADALQEWTSRLYDSVDSAEKRRSVVWKVPAQDGMGWPSIHSANARQRDLLTDVLWHLHDLSSWDGTGLPPQLLGVCAGSAGTGKTFIQQFVTLMCNMFYLVNDSSVMVAPTGVAAQNCHGSTPERALGMASRSSTKFLPPTTNKLGKLQEKHARVRCLLVDEMSMVGKCFMGQLAKAAANVFNQGEFTAEVGAPLPLWGGLPIVLFFGDFCQLPPVMDPGGPLHGNGGRRCDVVSYGGLAYRSLITQYTLTEPCRQKASDGLYRELQKARNAVTDSDSATFWNGRQELHLGREEREAFQKVDTPKLLFLTCTRKAAADVNAAYMRTLKGCCRCRAVVEGSKGHAKTDSNRLCGSAKSIPLDTMYAVGMDVKLTTNICPELMLCNGSRGVIVDIIYPGDTGYVPPPRLVQADDGEDEEPVFPIVIVDFPGYCGPSLLTDVAQAAAHPTLVPIVARALRCERSCCSRHGLPLVCGKADTVHSAQGITIGRGQALTRCLLMWNAKMEALWPGIFYVAASRVKELGAFALRQSFCKADAASIGVGAAALQTRREMDRIAAKAEQHSAARDPARTFEAGLRWFCAHVKAQVREKLEVEPELEDVIAVCEAWEDGLGSVVV